MESLLMRPKRASTKRPDPVQVYLSSAHPNRPSGVDILGISNTFAADWKSSPESTMNQYEI